MKTNFGTSGPCLVGPGIVVETSRSGSEDRGLKYSAIPQPLCVALSTPVYPSLDCQCTKRALLYCCALYLSSLFFKFWQYDLALTGVTGF